MSSNVAASDLGVGRAVFGTRLQLSMQAMRMCLWLAFMPGFILPLAWWLSSSTPQDVDIVKTSVIAHFTAADSYSEWRIRDENGKRQIVTAITDDGAEYQSLTPQQVKNALSKKWKVVSYVQWLFGFSLVFGVACFAMMWTGLRWLGARSQLNRRVRGAKDIVTKEALNSLVRKEGKTDYTLVDVALPRVSPMSGILIEGAQGTGKSLALHDLMGQVFRRKRKCIIYDQSGEFYRAYFRPGKDFFFNPACEGSVPWSIFSELRYSYDADTLAQAFLPPKGGVVQGASAFFEDAARALFSVILLRLAEHGAQNTRDIAKAFFDMPDDEMNKLIEKSVASSAVGGDSKAQRQGVISSIAIYLNGIASVAPGNWSIRDFLDRDDDCRLFIVGTDDTKAMFMPLFRLMLAVTFDVIAAKQEIVHTDKYWFFMDESHTLGDVKLDDQLATKRKFGVCIVSGIQSQSQYMSMMGKDRGETVLNCFNTVLMLRMNEPGMMEKAAAMLSKQDVEVVAQNQALAVTEWRDGAGMARNIQEKWVVMPAEIGALDNCNGYLKLVGSFPVAKVDYSWWLPRGFWHKGRVHLFAAKQESPLRAKQFALTRTYEAGTVDPFAMVTNSMKKGSSDQSSGSGNKREIDSHVTTPIDSETGEITASVEIEANEANQLVVEENRYTQNFTFGSE